MVEAESAMWCAFQILNDLGLDNEFGAKLKPIRESLRGLAGELRTYNDQFETDE